MARPYLRTYTLLAPDPDGLFQDQTLGGAGDFTLNGAGVSGGVWASTDNLAHKFDFESAGNLSALTITITGTTHKKKAISETLTGPNNSTVTTSKYYKTVTSVSVDGAVGTNIEAGPSDEAIGPVYVLDFLGSAQTTLAVNVGGVIDYTVQVAFDDPFETDNQDMTWTNHSVMRSRNETANSYIDSYARSARLKINSYSAGAIAQIVFIKNKH